MSFAQHPELNESPPQLAGFVLAGGQSTRMGADKALVLLDGRSLVAHALGILAEVGIPAAIAGAQGELSSIAPVVQDAAPGQGPLAGVCSALLSTRAELAVFLAVDQPLLPASLVVFLAQHAQTTGRPITLCSVNGFAQTFPAVIRREALPLLAGSLDAGRGGCFRAFEAAAVASGQPLTVLAAELLAQSGQAQHPGGLPPVQWFLNVNDVATLRQAEAVFARCNRVK